MPIVAGARSRCRGETGCVTSHWEKLGPLLGEVGGGALRPEGGGQQEQTGRKPGSPAGPADGHDRLRGPTSTMGVVGWAEPASGSTVTAAALTSPPAGTGICSTLAWPSASGLKVTEGTGFAVLDEPELVGPVRRAPA